VNFYIIISVTYVIATSVTSSISIGERRTTFSETQELKENL